MSAQVRMVQSDLAYQGQEPLFKLRATKLGSGGWVLAASWMHNLMDGESSHSRLQLHHFICT